MGRPADPNATPEMLRRREVERERYRIRSKRLKALQKARGIKPIPSNQYTTTDRDRMELIDAPIKPTSIGWEHISSGRSNS